MSGVQRIRCYPFQKTKNFAGRTFHGKNVCDFVGLIPKESTLEDFSYGSQANSVSVARTQLFFEFNLQPHDGSEAFFVEAAFVHHLLQFADALGHPLYRHDGQGRDRQGNTTKYTKQLLLLYCYDVLCMVAVERDMWHTKGYEILYETTEPKGPSYDIVAMERILGLCPVIRLYRNLHGTIPEWASKQCASAFPVGRRHLPTKDGSRTYAVNSLALKFSR